MNEQHTNHIMEEADGFDAIEREHVKMKLRDIVASIGKVQPESVGVDGFPVLKADPLQHAHTMLGEYLRAHCALDEEAREAWAAGSLDQGKAILDASPALRGQLICALITRLAWITTQTYYEREVRTRAFVMMWERLLARSRVYENARLGDALELLGELDHTSGEALPWPKFLRSVEDHLASQGLEQDLLVGLMALKGSPLFALVEEGSIALRVRVEKMIAGCHAPHVELGVPWADAMQAEVDALTPEDQANWDALLEHLPTSSNKPSSRWLKRARALLEDVGADSARGGLIRWLPLVGQKATMSFDGRPAWDPVATIPCERNEEMLRGMVWLSILVSDETLSAIVGELAVTCYKKIAHIGPRCPRLGNACIHALGQMEELSSVGQLWRLAQQITYASAQRMIDQAIQSAADRHALSVEDMEDLSVPTFGLDARGHMTREVGDWRFELTLDGPHQIHTQWVRERVNGQTQLFALFEEPEVRNNPPRQARADHPEILAELNAIPRELEKNIQVQRDRIEGFYLQPREWSFSQWYGRYLEHPIMSLHARRLIWSVSEPGCQTRHVIWRDGELVESSGEVLDRVFIAPDAVVRLWHPVESTAEEVEAWREWLVTHRVTQPFKQAHRERYQVERVGRSPDIYTQEMPAEVLKQHQFAALCKSQSWSCKLQGTWEVGPMPRRALDAFGVSAQFWVHAINDRSLTTRAGAYVYVFGNHLRFLDRDEQPIPLDEVDPVVFSEVMRDVELFVNVAGVTDEQMDEVLSQALEQRGVTWSAGRQRMSGAAKVRAAVLGRLLPEFEWGARCEVDGTNLRVEGEGGVYSLHLGTGMARDASGRVVDMEAHRARVSAREADVLKPWLPFEGDAMLVSLIQRVWLLATGEERQRRVV